MSIQNFKLLKNMDDKGKQIFGNIALTFVIILTSRSLI